MLRDPDPRRVRGEKSADEMVNHHPGGIRITDQVDHRQIEGTAESGTKKIRRRLLALPFPVALNHKHRLSSVCVRGLVALHHQA